jgi:hypothetical protein
MDEYKGSPALDAGLLPGIRGTVSHRITFVWKARIFVPIRACGAKKVRTFMAGSGLFAE